MKKNATHVELNISITTVFLNKQILKMIFNTYKFSNNNNNNFILLLGKVIYSYEYMGDWEKSNEISLSEKKRFLQPLKYGRYY